MATGPQPQNIWKGGALIWEDSKDYLYARTTTAGRIIIGGGIGNLIDRFRLGGRVTDFIYLQAGPLLLGRDVLLAVQQAV